MQHEKALFQRGKLLLLMAAFLAFLSLIVCAQDDNIATAQTFTKYVSVRGQLESGTFSEGDSVNVMLKKKQCSS